MTTSKSKARGSAFERLVANYVGGKRTYSSGQHKDVGDVHVQREWLTDCGARTPRDLIMFECKDVARPDFPKWLNETEVERQNAGARYGFLVWKRRGWGAEDAYVVLTLSQLMDLLGGDA